MPDIFDRLSSLLKSMFNDSGSSGSTSSGTYHARDDYEAEAWDELEEFLNKGKGDKRESHARPRTESQDPEAARKRARYLAELEAIRPDFETLKVKFGAPFEEVKKAYKKLLVQYHPDKHAGDPERFRMATELAKKINQAFQRIKDFIESHA